MKKKIFGILLLLILIIYSIVFLKKRTTEREIKNRKYLFEIKSSNNWRIKKITDKHLLYQGNTNKIFPNSNIENEV